MLRARYDFEVWAPSLLFWETRKQVTEAGGACLSEQLWASPVGIFHSAHGVCPDKSPMAMCPCDGQLSQPFCPIFWWNLVCRHVCSCQGVPGGGQRPRLRGVSETQTGMWRNLCGCSVSWGAVQCGLSVELCASALPVWLAAGSEPGLGSALAPRPGAEGVLCEVDSVEPIGKDGGKDWVILVQTPQGCMLEGQSHHYKCIHADTSSSRGLSSCDFNRIQRWRGLERGHCWGRAH